jgi:hypothetical protein
LKTFFEYAGNNSFFQRDADKCDLSAGMEKTVEIVIAWLAALV